MPIKTIKMEIQDGKQSSEVEPFLTKLHCHTAKPYGKQSSSVEPFVTKYTYVFPSECRCWNHVVLCFYPPCSSCCLSPSLGTPLSVPCCLSCAGCRSCAAGVVAVVVRSAEAVCLTAWRTAEAAAATGGASSSSTAAAALVVAGAGAWGAGVVPALMMASQGGWVVGLTACVGEGGARAAGTRIPPCVCCVGGFGHSVHHHQLSFRLAGWRPWCVAPTKALLLCVYVCQHFGCFSLGAYSGNAVDAC